MNTLSQEIINDANQIINDATELDGELTANAQTIADQTKVISNLTNVNNVMTTANNGLQGQISSLVARKSFFDLQQCPLFTVDKKIPFQWIQPGNTGNSGGGSPVPHGTSSWTVQGDGSARVTVNPVKLPNGQSDNFLFYMVLPYPHSKPNRFYFDCSRFNAASEADWGNSQQMEFWDELIDDGFIYTMNWSVNPVQGLQYFDRTKNAWIQFMPLGKPVLVDMGKSTSWSFVASIDRVKHTVLYETLNVGTTQYEVGATCLAPMKAGAQFSTSIQLDGKAAAPSYSAILDQLKVSYQ